MGGGKIACKGVKRCREKTQEKEKDNVEDDEDADGEDDENKRIKK